MSNCYTHTNKKAAGQCSYCKAEYCSSCLSVIGVEEAIICENCHATLSQRFYHSMMSRKKYIYIGYIIIILTAYLTVWKWGEGAGYLALILLLFIVGLIFVTKRRVAEMKLFLKAKSFDN